MVRHRPTRRKPSGPERCLTRLAADGPGEVSLCRRDLIVLDPAEQRLRPRRAVALRQIIEVRDAGYRAFEELLEPLYSLRNVRCCVVGERAEQDGAGIEREAGLLRVLLAGLPRGVGPRRRSISLQKRGRG